ncbi:MAG: hypothetical protein FWE09_05995 [Treponema sp.]|nr:hypothetical protein [Treponema sp.]
MKDSGRGGENRHGRRKHSRRKGGKEGGHARQERGRGHSGDSGRGKGGKSVNSLLFGSIKIAKKPAGPRLKWQAPETQAPSLEPSDCPICGKPVKDFATAISCRETGAPTHFDCAVSQAAERERLEAGDSIGYIGGGRFGVIRPSGEKGFQIRKILDWEVPKDRSGWRTALCDFFSAT